MSKIFGHLQRPTFLTQDDRLICSFCGILTPHGAQPPRETSCGAATTHIAQSDHAYPTTMVPTKEPAPRTGHHLLARVRSRRHPVHLVPVCRHFAALVCSFFASRVSHLAIAPRMMRVTRRRRCSARRPQPTHATPLPLTRQPRVGEPPKTRRRCRPPPVGGPSQTKTTKTRDLLQNRPSITQERRNGPL
jgi:hypothetical protein